MSYSIEISDKATPALRGVDAAIAGARPVIGRSAVNCFRNHLFRMDAAHPNELGGRRTHFYADAARGTNFVVVPEGVLLSVNQVGINQRVYGGTIEAEDHLLTIPAIAEAYGHRAREFPDLKFVVLNGHPALIKPELPGPQLPAAPGVRRKGTKEKSAPDKRGGEVMYWLAHEVTQEGDRSLVPDDHELGEAVLSDVGDYLARLRRRGGGE